jgi:hypothetical protein
VSWKLILAPIIFLFSGLLLVSCGNDEVTGIAEDCESLFGEVADTLRQAFDERDKLTPELKEGHLDAIDTYVSSAETLLNEIKSSDEIGQIAWPFWLVRPQIQAQDLALGLLRDFPELESRYHSLVPALYQCNRFVAVSRDKVLSFSEAREQFSLEAGWKRRQLERDLIYILRSMEKSDGMEQLTAMLIDAQLVAAQ